MASKFIRAFPEPQLSGRVPHNRVLFRSLQYKRCIGVDVQPRCKKTLRQALQRLTMF